MPKNILFYMPNLSRSQGGIFQYAIRVLDSLSELDCRIIVYSTTEREFLLNRFSDAERIKIPLVKPQSKTLLVKNKLKRISTLLNKEIKAFPQLLTNDIPDELIREFKIDLIHSPNQRYPDSEIPFIFTLHDVQELHFPQFFTPLERENRARNNRVGCELAERIIVSYEHVKADLIRLFGVPSEKIEVVFIGASDNSMTPRENTLEIDSNILLYPAASWPHKNHINLLKAFAKARELSHEMSDYQLICTGHLTDHFNEIENLIQELNLADHVAFKGLVSDKELKNLYAQAAAVVVPTKYEAGSFPLMESIVQHIPVICSNVTSLPSTIENSDFIFEPDNLEDMALKIQRICLDREFRKMNVQNSIRVREKLINPGLSKNLESIYSDLV